MVNIVKETVRRFLVQRILVLNFKGCLVIVRQLLAINLSQDLNCFLTIHEISINVHKMYAYKHYLFHSFYFCIFHLDRKEIWYFHIYQQQHRNCYQQNSQNLETPFSAEIPISYFMNLSFSLFMRFQYMKFFSFYDRKYHTYVCT